VILGAVFIHPNYKELKTLQISAEEKRLELQSREGYVSHLRELSEKLQEYDQQLATVDSALPSKPDIPDLCDFFQKTASRHGLILENISPALVGPVTKELEEAKEPQIIGINLTLTGSYSSLKEFLSTLENSARIIETDSISFSSPGEEEVFTFKLNLKVYSY